MGALQDELGGQRFAQTARECFGGETGARFVRGTDGEQDGVLEGREIAALTELQFLLEVAGEIVVPRELNRRAERREGLHENFARDFAAAGAAGDLREQLETFARPRGSPA